jgi:hypothetical protein
MLKRMSKVITAGIAVLGALLLLVQSAPAAPPQPLLPSEFVEAAPQGFGDRQNSAAWSMQWWKGKLYVGTVRAWFCWVQAWANINVSPLIPYPPNDPNKDCAPDPRDLPLQAEIWRYTPETNTWERVYQAPNDVEIPGSPGKYTARDIGYRGMTVFTESDGTEALYVGGATSYALWPPMPPPRILRSTDGTTFEPIPQDPGTFLGDLGFRQSTFRSMEVYKGRLYVINGDIQGQGAVLEAENPAGGNDNFRQITPPGMQVFEMAVFNGFLYFGLADRYKGYSVVKTDAMGTPPYTFTPVVTNGGFLQPSPSMSVVSMSMLDDRLYVGTDSPVEVIRINPDDSWDLVVGTPRQTPDGWKYPLSGMGTGFDWPLTSHAWRMQAHQGVLYVGTNDDKTTTLSSIPVLGKLFDWQAGFDLYESSDGYYFVPITLNGFGDKFQVGLRTLASTPYGLFLGTVDYWYGLRIWQGTPGEVGAASLSRADKLPESEGSAVVGRAGISPSVAPDLNRNSTLLGRPERLEVESKDGAVVLSWIRPPGATRFHIFRSDFATNRQLRDSDLKPNTPVPGPFTEIGTTDQFFFMDSSVQPDRPYQYYVLAEDPAGTLSEPSNVVRAPSLAPGVTFGSLRKVLDSTQDSGKPKSLSATVEISQSLEDARNDVRGGDMEHALHRLEQLSQNIEDDRLAELAPWQVEDLEILLAKLARRISLAQAGLISPADLN